MLVGDSVFVGAIARKAASVRTCSRDSVGDMKGVTLGDLPSARKEMVELVEEGA